MSEIDCPMDVQGWCRRVKPEERESEIDRARRTEDETFHSGKVMEPFSQETLLH